MVLVVLFISMSDQHQYVIPLKPCAHVHVPSERERECVRVRVCSRVVGLARAGVTCVVDISQCGPVPLCTPTHRTAPLIDNNTRAFGALVLH